MEKFLILLCQPDPFRFSMLSHSQLNPSQSPDPPNFRFHWLSFASFASRNSGKPVGKRNQHWNHLLFINFSETLYKPSYGNKALSFYFNDILEIFKTKELCFNKASAIVATQRRCVFISRFFFCYFALKKVFLFVFMKLSNKNLSVLQHQRLWFPLLVFWTILLNCRRGNE